MGYLDDVQVEMGIYGMDGGDFGVCQGRQEEDGVIYGQDVGLKRLLWVEFLGIEGC